MEIFFRLRTRYARCYARKRAAPLPQVRATRASAVRDAAPLPPVTRFSGLMPVDCSCTAADAWRRSGYGAATPDPTAAAPSCRRRIFAFHEAR